MKKQTKQTSEKQSSTEKPSAWQALCKLAYEANQSGKSEDARKVYEYASANPPEVGVWRGMSSTIESSISGLLAKGGGSRAMLNIEVIAMRDGLGYDESSEIEKLMINRVVMCWMRMMYAEQYLSWHEKESRILAHIEFAQRAWMRANNQYTRAVESLARVRVLTQRIGSEQRPKAKLALVK